MTLHAFACRVAAALTAVNRSPVAILLFMPACLLFIAAGWALGETQLFLLILTTALSVDGSWTNRMQLLKQGQQAGEVEG